MRGISFVLPHIHLGDILNKSLELRVIFCEARDILLEHHIHFADQFAFHLFILAGQFANLPARDAFLGLAIPLREIFQSPEVKRKGFGLLAILGGIRKYRLFFRSFLNSRL